MHAEIFLAIMVLAVALLVAADFFRRTSDGPHEHAERSAHDAGSPGRGAFTPSRSGGGAAGSAAAAPVTAFEPARTGRPGSARPGPGTGTAPSRPPAGGRAGTGSAPAKSPGRAKGSWLVRTRLSLLAAASALAAAAATASAIRALDVLGGAAYHSDVSSIRDGATASAILAGLAAVAALAVGGWAAAALIRSVLRPLDQLRTGAVELAEVRLPDALRSGGRGPLAVRSVGISSSDEIGQIARAFDQVQAEVLGVTSDEAGLRGKLGEMFVELSSRGQALVERQLKLIDELERGERNSERRASLLKMDHIATRMRRYSQNLLVLAGHELPGEWSRPVTLADVIRAAVSQIEDYEKVSLSAEPGISVSGPAVKDVVHLLAELAENGASLSPAGSQVDVSGRSLASGGVLVDVTDQGVGMNPEVMAEVNRRLDSPPAMDFAVSRNMGLFVVGRLAARHGIKVRLQAATAGGLTALVWLPDAVASRPDGGTGFDGAAGFDGANTGPARGAHAAARLGLSAGTGADGAPGRDTLAGSMWSAPVMEDVRPQTAPAPGSRPGHPSAAASTAAARHAWPDTALQPRFHPHPPAPAEPSPFSPSSDTDSPSPFSQSSRASSPSAFSHPSDTDSLSSFIRSSEASSPSPFSQSSGTSSPPFGESSAPSTPSAFSRSLGISSPSAFSHPSEASSPSAFPQPPADAGPSSAPASPVRTQPSSLPQRLVASPRPAPAQPAPAQSVPAQSPADASASPAVGADLPSGLEAGFAADTAAADAGDRRLPIYDSVESDWFGNRRKQAGRSAAADIIGWTTPADPGWNAAQAAVSPASSGTTAAGLPVRSPRANLVPGTIGSGATGSGPASPGPASPGPASPGPASPSPDKPPIPRSASAVRDRLSGFQRGTSQGRAALNHDAEDHAP
jgi:signal transduction histidine kinase